MFVTFNPEQLRDALGPPRCTFGMPAVMAILDREGKLKPTIGRQKTQHSDQRWVDLFNGAGMPSELEADMLNWLRCHVPLTAAMESVAVAAQRRGGRASWAEAMRVAHGLHGGFAIIKGLGYPLYPRSKAVLNALPTFQVAFLLWAISRVTAFREVLAQGTDEARALADSMGRAAAAKPALAPAVKAVLALKPTS